ncbi:MAG: RND family transporter [Sandaracinaceae bacterium]
MVSFKLRAPRRALGSAGTPPMVDLPAQIAALVTRRALTVVALTVLLTLAFASQIPNIIRNPSPEDLVASLDGMEAGKERFRADFGDTDQVAVLLVEADDVLTPQVLRYVYALTHDLADLPHVLRVDSVTETPIAKPDDGEEESLTLDDLGGDEFEDDVPDDVLSATLTLAEVDPDHFPNGIQDFADRRAELEPTPALTTHEITEEDAARLRDALADMPMVRGRLISEDGTLAAVVVALPTEPEARLEGIDAVDDYLDEYPPPDGVELHRGGLPYVRATMVTKMERDNRVLLPLTVLVCVVLLYIAFRSLAGTFLPLFTVAVSATILVGSMAILGEPLNILTNIVPPLLIIIGISDSIHLVGRFRDELRFRPRAAALKETVKSMATACFFTSVTTAVGIASLLVSTTRAVRVFAVIASIGVMIAYVVTIAFLPSSLVYTRGPTAAPPPRSAVVERGLVVVTRWVMRRRWLVLSCATVVVIAMGFTISGVSVDHALMDQFDDEDAIAQTTVLLERRLEGLRPLEVSMRVEDPATFRDPELLQRVDDISAWAVEQDGVLGASSVTDVYHEVWRRLTGDPEARSAPFRSAEQIEALLTLLRYGEHGGLEHYLTEDGRHARLRIMMADIGAKATMRFVDDLEDRLDPVRDAGVDIELTGEAYTGSVGTNAVIGDVLGSLSMAIVIIFVVLTVLFRSVRLGLLSIPPNVFPLVGAMAWMVARGIPLNLGTAIIFSISLGLAVDGSIHVLARFREEVGHGAIRSVALVRAARGTGRAILVSCGTLMLGFGTLLFSSFVPVRHFGELIAVTAALCLIATLVIQPALLRVGAADPNKVGG